eukprot:scaffold961_cov35-Cyclotella_meneghiniana.AAC.1
MNMNRIGHRTHRSQFVIPTTQIYDTMKLRLSLLLPFSGTITAQTTTTLTPSSLNTNLAQSSTNLLTAQNGGLVSITSDIPVTISRYNDDLYADGEQPVLPTDAYVVVTSDCNDAAAPLISWDYSNGASITISSTRSNSIIDISSYLNPITSYMANWSFNNWNCELYPTPAPFASSVFSDVPTVVGQGVTIQEKGEVITMDEYQEEQQQNKESESESDDVPFSEEEYKPSDPSAAGRQVVVPTILLGGVLLLTIMMITTGDYDYYHRVWKVGMTVTTAVLSLSPLASRLSKSSSFPNTASRSLQNTCIYQAEIMLDGCTHPLSINAPMVRIVDADVINSKSQRGGVDEPCLYDYAAEITFPVDGGSVTNFEGDDNNGVGVSVDLDALSYSQCVRATDGRPFVDSYGGALLASPLIGEVCSSADSCTSSSSSDLGVEHTTTSSTWDNDTTTITTEPTNIHHTSLGEEWTQRALGEHASIASFSSFSIALLTNGAPSTLVEDALIAAMDEVRHAHTSFDIASRLIGKEVKAGPLPPSTLEYTRDLVSLGLSVAREGCVDETLSAMGAAMESLELKKSTEKGGGKYAKLDDKTADWISRELTNIAMEEASHSALAWRTLFWVCTVDAKACNVVKSEVLDATELELRFQYRFAKLFKNKPEALEEMRMAWNEITQKLVTSLDTFNNTAEMKMDYKFCLEMEQDVESQTNILSDLTNSILRGALC